MRKGLTLCLSIVSNLFFVTLLIVTLFSINSVSAHDSHMHTAPWEACENMQKSRQCSYINGDDDLFQGTCQLFSDVLMCVRNQPIIHVTHLAKHLVKDMESAKIKSKNEFKTKTKTKTKDNFSQLSED